MSKYTLRYVSGGMTARYNGAVNFSGREGERGTVLFALGLAKKNAFNAPQRRTARNLERFLKTHFDYNADKHHITEQELSDGMEFVRQLGQLSEFAPLDIGGSVPADTEARIAELAVQFRRDGVLSAFRDQVRSTRSGQTQAATVKPLAFTS